MSPAGSARPPMPRPRTSQVAPILVTGQPSACSALAVSRTSTPSNRPQMRVRPVASAPNISARWQIDLSPGTRTRPDSARDLPADSGDWGWWDTGAAPRFGYARPLVGGPCCAAIEQRGVGLSTPPADGPPERFGLRRVWEVANGF